jgi:hypothetical protein
MFLNIPLSPHRNLRVVWIPPVRAKVAVHWLACFQHDILPDMSNPKWVVYQCSERCTNFRCFRKEHLCWEEAGKNQSRGHSRSYCTRICAHPGCSSGHVLCRCQNLHNPCCVDGSRPDSLE